ncbi:MAG: NAD(P)H dehydrogenase assembly family protein [Cyanobium sp.]
MASVGLSRDSIDPGDPRPPAPAAPAELQSGESIADDAATGRIDSRAGAPAAGPSSGNSSGAVSGEGRGAAGAAAPTTPLRIGDRVVVEGQLPYFKSADPMPMLRPPDLVDSGEQGQVVEIRAMDQLAVRFRRGIFLIAAGHLRRV